MDLAANYFIMDRINMLHILRDQQALGAHTDIVIFNSKAITTFRWTHPGARPMGNYTSASTQCPDCLWLKTIKPRSIRKKSSILQCSGCGWNETYKLPEGFQWCQGEDPTNGLERGAWMSRVEATFAKISDDKMEVN
jgi:predicted RNA-binding Zn-ribbon protein involved in translation (DUF1610 family)